MYQNLARNESDSYLKPSNKIIAHAFAWEFKIFFRYTTMRYLH